MLKNTITDLGIFFLMLLAGLEVQPGEFLKASTRSIFVALGGMFLPLILGATLGWLWLPPSAYRVSQALLLGVALAITAVPVTIKVLMDLGYLNTPAGQVILSAAVLDDILSLLLLAVLTGILETGALPGAFQLLFLGSRVLLFFVITFLAGRYLFPFILKKILRRTSLEEFEFSLLLIVALSFAVLAELLGIHFILGAFAAGTLFVRRTLSGSIYDDVLRKISAITNGFLAPIFFVSIGLHLDPSAFVHIPLFVAALILTAVLGKLAGTALPARGIGLSRRDSLLVGVGMNSRGAVELVIADIALRAGIFRHPAGNPLVENLFSAIVIMAIVTTLATPLALKWILHSRLFQER